MLIQKDKTKRNIVSNDRPITRLPLVWMLLTGILTNEIYDYLEKKSYFQRKRRGVDESVTGQVIYCSLTK